MDFEKQMIMRALDSLEKVYIENVYSDNESFDKNIEKSIQARRSGNQQFAKRSHGAKAHEEILKFYTKSIAFAPTESEELAAGFANRSTLLLHLKKYKDALSDVERALKVTQSSVLKVKLLCRRIECFVALQEGKQNNSLEKAKYWLNKVEDENERLNLNKIIEKAQKIMDDNKPDRPEKEKRNDMNCGNDAVVVSYDEKYGRGLLATRDIEPGEAVHIEKYYVASVNQTKMYVYCSNCLGMSWALIPCDHCAYYLYCSEKCKTKAWQKYHDIECDMKYATLHKHIGSYFVELGIRSLIMGIKETGSIKKLKNLINTVDSCKDKKTKGFSDSGKFSRHSFRSLYSLKSCKNDEKIGFGSTAAITAINSLAKNTKIFGKNFQYNFDNLEQHEDAAFIVCLLLKLISISALNAFSVQSVSEDCDVDGNITRCLQSFCCARGMSISLMTSLINHSCDNNVNKFYTNDGKVVYYATKPIKTNSQVFSCYYFNYTYMKKEFRQAMISGIFEFDCSCLACQQNWPTAKIIYENDKRNKYKSVANYTDLTLKIMHKNHPLIVSTLKRNYYSRKEIQSLAKDIALLYAEESQKPNMVTTSFHSVLSNMIEKRYFSVLKMPNTCSSENKDLI